MKTKNFNKIGGTEFRVKNQINGYLAFADWFLSSKERTDENFKNWTKESGIYDYGNDRIKRLNMVLHNAEKKYKIIKNVDGKYIYNINNVTVKDDILNNLANSSNISGLDKQTCVAFRAMLDFMIQNPNLTDAHRIFRSFAVYEDGDDFSALYHLSRFYKTLAEKQIPIGAGREALTTNIYSRKPSVALRRVCQNILSNKQYFTIESNDFDNLWNSYLFPYKTKHLFEDFVKSSSFDTIARDLFANSKAHLLEDEYFDLFNRVLWGLDISPSSGRHVYNYLNANVYKTNNRYSVTKQSLPSRLPYSLSEINEYLKLIQNSNFGFMENDPHLSSKPRADIAEYFVNIKFVLIFGINISEIREWIHTNLDHDLYPTSHASGGMSDMNYIKGDKLYGIETTLHRTVRSIINNEFMACIDHLDSHRSNKRKLILILVEPISNEPSLVDHFNSVGQYCLSRRSQGKTLSTKAYNFSEIADLLPNSQI